MELPSPYPPRKLGQACDRCRKKKIKCDGALPACRNCTKANQPCEASGALQRNTRVRGFITDDKHVEDLQNQLMQCQQALQMERDTIALLRQQFTQQLVPDPSASLPPSRIRIRVEPDDSAYVIKHMGRMVHDEAGIGRFAGSTTGVHFVLSVVETCKRSIDLIEAFSEGCYNLYLGQPTTRSDFGGNFPLDEEIIQYFGQPVCFYTDQIEEFFRHWAAFCPVLARKQLFEAIHIHNLIDAAQNHATLVAMDQSTVCILFSIMSINCLTHGTIGQHGGSLELSANTRSLQVLAIFALYHQLTGKSLSLIQLNGHMVRIAQSLGLHRHARRFRITIGEIELRKRLWWWIYIFDRITATVHGLPPLISDTDVDNDMPTDCRLLDLEAGGLLHPLPGETTPVFLFNLYATMGKKMSSILDILYTTTQRRQGSVKIEKLDREMRVWSQNLDPGDDPLYVRPFLYSGPRLMHLLWKASKEDHDLSSELFEKLPEWLEKGTVKPNHPKVLHGLDAVPEGFQEYRDGKISAYKIVYEI
ncbi:fungal-specific transcription factor domain-containing protein [Aspergillus spectabilis]